MMTFSYPTILSAVMAEQEAIYRSLGRFPFGQRVTVNHVHGSYRSRPIVNMRAVVAVLCVNYMLEGSFPKIGRMMHKDHSSVMRLVTTAARRFDEISNFMAAVDARLQATAEAVQQSDVAMTSVNTEHVHLPSGVPLQ